MHSRLCKKPFRISPAAPIETLLAKNSGNGMPASLTLVHCTYAAHFFAACSVARKPDNWNTETTYTARYI